MFLYNRFLQLHCNSIWGIALSREFVSGVKPEIKLVFMASDEVWGLLIGTAKWMV